MSSLCLVFPSQILFQLHCAALIAYILHFESQQGHTFEDQVGDMVLALVAWYALVHHCIFLMNEAINMVSCQ